jgi:hypothetical protein
LENGIQVEERGGFEDWIPAFAGMTDEEKSPSSRYFTTRQLEGGVVPFHQLL